MNWLIDLVTNHFFVVGVSSWLTAQVAKTIIHALLNKKLDLTRLFGDGGMPSGHSATVVSVATLSALVYGTGSFEFALSGILAIIVCHDATGVRRETGKQAIIINEMIQIFEELKAPLETEIKLKEFVGHSPVQVLAGMLLGALNAVLMYLFVF
ncbi:MAG: divergent PAP2 family protein [Oscillospiraceae bacterium]|nr:divergent PAP2 family protein [Oscillospiraceae bacterium]